MADQEDPIADAQEAAVTILEAAVLANNTATGETKPSKKAVRINWGVGAAKAQLEQAVLEWDQKTGRALHPETKNLLSLRDYAKRVAIPYHTFRKYVVR